MDNYNELYAGIQAFSPQNNKFIVLRKKGTAHLNNRTFSITFF